jgi:hypothetical protein
MAPLNLMAGNQSIERCCDLLREQLIIAQSWRDKASRANDVFAQFFFAYTGFNALYFAWNKASPAASAKEKDQITVFLRRFRQKCADEVLAAVNAEVEYFLARRPIQQMRYRNCDQPLEGPDSEGREVQENLKPDKPSGDRLAALGEIIYYVRCNLVHGSKAERGDDETVITKAIGPLCHILQAAIEYTEDKLGSQ